MAVPDTNTFSLSDVVNEVNPSSNDLYQCFEDSIVSNFDPNYSPSSLDPYKSDKSGYEQYYFRNYGDSNNEITVSYDRIRKLYTAHKYLVGRLDDNYVVLFKIWDNGQIYLLDVFDSFYNTIALQTETYSKVGDFEIYYSSNDNCTYLFIGFFYDANDDGDGVMRWHELKIDDIDGKDASITFFDYGTDSYSSGKFTAQGTYNDSIAVSDYADGGSPQSVIMMNNLKEPGSGEVQERWSYFYHIGGSKCSGATQDNTQYHSTLTDKELKEADHKMITRTSTVAYFYSFVQDGLNYPYELRVRKLTTSSSNTWGTTSSVNLNNVESARSSCANSDTYELFAVDCIDEDTAYARETQKIAKYKYDTSSNDISLIDSSGEYQNYFTDSKGWIGNNMCSSGNSVYVINLDINNDKLITHRFTHSTSSISYDSTFSLSISSYVNEVSLDSVVNSLTFDDSSKDYIYINVFSNHTNKYSLYIIKWDSTDGFSDVSLSK